MSHRFRPPKQHPNEGSMRARMRRSAALIPDQPTLDRILSSAEPAIASAWLNEVRPFLRFIPAQFTNLESASPDNVLQDASR